MQTNRDCILGSLFSCPSESSHTKFWSKLRAIFIPTLPSTQTAVRLGELQIERISKQLQSFCFDQGTAETPRCQDVFLNPECPAVFAFAAAAAAAAQHFIFHQTDLSVQGS